MSRPVITMLICTCRLDVPLRQIGVADLMIKTLGQEIFIY